MLFVPRARSIAPSAVHAVADVAGIAVKLAVRKAFEGAEVARASTVAEPAQVEVVPGLPLSFGCVQFVA